MIPPRTLARLFGAATALLLLGAAQPAPEYSIDAIRYGTIRGFRTSGLVVGADPAERMDIALVFWLVRGDGRVILVDSGFHRWGAAQGFDVADYLRPDSALMQAGVQPSQVTDLVLTHAHWDHMGGIDLFPNATIHIQRAEYEYYTGPAWREGGRHGGIDQEDVVALVRRNMAGRVVLVDGDDQQILPGIRGYTGARHTYASQYLLVEGSEPWVLASDNCYLFRNLETHTAGGTFLPDDRAGNEAALRRMVELAGSPARIVPGHDPLVFERFPTLGRIARIR
jgi:glyoxylase-like metal-dependent hydrolase (beta-lactamase superfamily II)